MLMPPDVGMTVQCLQFCDCTKKSSTGDYIMKWRNTFVIASLATFTLWGCGARDDDNDDEAPSLSPKQQLLGDWSSACKQVQEGEGPQFQPNRLGLFAHERLSFNEPNSFARTLVLFSDDNCTQPIATRVVTGTFETGGENVGELLGPTPLGLTINDASVTPLSKEVVDAMNSAKYCGIENWELAVNKHVINAACSEGTLSANTKIQEQFEIDMRNLYLTEAKMGLLTPPPEGQQLNRDRPFAKLPD